MRLILGANEANYVHLPTVYHQRARTGRVLRMHQSMKAQQRRCPEQRVVDPWPAPQLEVEDRTGYALEGRAKENNDPGYR